MKSLSILGATGSIGSNALEIVRQFPDRFTIVALTAKTHVAALARQIVEFTPRLAAVIDAEHARQLKALLPPTVDVEIVFGETGYVAADLTLAKKLLNYRPQVSLKDGLRMTLEQDERLKMQ